MLYKRVLLQPIISQESTRPPFYSMFSDKPVVGEEFLVRFLQKYEIEEDIKMLLEMPANGEIGMAGTKDVASPAASQGLPVSLRRCEDRWGGTQCRDEMAEKIVYSAFGYLLQI